MFSYGICEGVGAIYLLNNMCRYQKNYGKTFFRWFRILTMKILALVICDTSQKNNPIFRYFPLSSIPSTYSVLKFGRYLISYISRNET